MPLFPMPRMLATALAVVAGIPALSGCTTVPASQAGIVPIDDGYTVSQRFEANRDAHPELALPVLDAGAGRQILFDRRYKTIGARELHLDLFLPAPSARPAQAIVLVHGGGWRSGNKSNFYAMAQRLAQRGYAVVLPEFRLAPEAGFPAGLVDINEALAFVRDHAAEFGIDPGRIAIGGESTGGHMAALLAYTGGTARFSPDGNPAPRVNALIDIDGVLDLTSPLALRFENRDGENSVAARWLGGSMERAPGRWQEANPAAYLDAKSPPTLIVSGEETRFTAGRETVSARLTEQGIPVRNIHFAGLPHTFWLFDPYVDQVVDAVDRFMRDDVGSKQ